MRLTNACSLTRQSRAADAGVRRQTLQEKTMGNYKGPTEGGSGGKRGHSSMEHWTHTEELKDSSRKHRRKEDKEEADQGLGGPNGKEDTET